MESYAKPGRYQVEQLLSKEVYRRDFDAEEWSYEWVDSDGVSRLRMLHDNAPIPEDTCEFVEFSLPVNISFVPDL